MKPFKSPHGKVGKPKLYRANWLLFVNKYILFAQGMIDLKTDLRYTNSYTLHQQSHTGAT
jgi:hypothetical protein